MVNATFRAAALAAVEPALDNLAEPLIKKSGRGHVSSYPYQDTLGSLDCKLYQPAEKIVGVRPALVVMLHGCSQSVDSFVLGTRMNQEADRHHCLVLYPSQDRKNNPAKCWNWFRSSNQRRDSGEAGLIAGATRRVVEEFDIDPSRVYVAGLSAGGAMAANLVELYPELYAASGIHSGLPARAAHNVTSAMRAMETGAMATGESTPANALPRPMIVFQGDADQTVHPSNAAALMHPYQLRSLTSTQSRTTINGREVVRTDFMLGKHSIAENWLIMDAGHAWSGGDASGSYADAKGPNASAEMMRFFLEHPNS
jgi:poly(hydroxyalkanoate) depolymerase family esterase